MRGPSFAAADDDVTIGQVVVAPRAARPAMRPGGRLAPVARVAAAPRNGPLPPRLPNVDHDPREERGEDQQEVENVDHLTPGVPSNFFSRPSQHSM